MVHFAQRNAPYATRHTSLTNLQMLLYSAAQSLGDFSMSKKQEIIGKEVDHRRTNGATISALLCSWLVLGNGAAIYFLLSNAVDGKLRNGFPYETAYALFLGGSVTAFLSLAIIFWVNARTRSILMQMFFDADANDNGAKARWKKSQDDMGFLGPVEVIAWILSFVSAACLAVGLFLPLTSGTLINGAPSDAMQATSAAQQPSASSSDIAPSSVPSLAVAQPSATDRPNEVSPSLNPPVETK